MTDLDLQARLDLALATARRAAAGTLPYFYRRDLAIEQKGDGTPVTLADREAEQYCRTQIIGSFPDDGILGEEYPERPGTSGFRWILDPIDGTKSFIRGVPLYGTLVGVEYQQRCVIGVVVLPALDEVVYAARGQGAWHIQGTLPPRRAQVSSIARLEQALFCTTSPADFDQHGRRQAYETLARRCWQSRGWSDCYGYVLVATGRVEIMLEPALSLWDMAALPAILEEAGGTFTSWKGEPTIYAGEGLATNGHLLERVLDITRTL